MSSPPPDRWTEYGFAPDDALAEAPTDVYRPVRPVEVRVGYAIGVAIAAVIAGLLLALIVAGGAWLVVKIWP